MQITGTTITADLLLLNCHKSNDSLDRITSEKAVSVYKLRGFSSIQGCEVVALQFEQHLISHVTDQQSY